MAPHIAIETRLRRGSLVHAAYVTEQLTESRRRYRDAAVEFLQRSDLISSRP
jgi:hypothetical protein